MEEEQRLSKPSGHLHEISNEISDVVTLVNIGVLW